MKAVFLNPFVKSVFEILESVVYETPEKGDIFIRERYPCNMETVSAMVGITGKLTGQVTLTMSRKSAISIAAKMMMEDGLEELDECAQSALAEMANMVAANAAASLCDDGYECDITTPTVITGSNIEISFRPEVKTIVIPLTLSVGSIDVNISVAETSFIKGLQGSARAASETAAAGAI
ncbi:MAG: CheY-P phosphatase CheX [bacterium ADurb.Bin236]|nr:MAG: CheY-P phosphatase CheX [bacterium ADurb.Bin236]HOY62310.1 chemotaxis protein CheX [bacterium]HPN93155.1 chemotaxis protein CheX [bacterium]